MPKQKLCFLLLMMVSFAWQHSVVAQDSLPSFTLQERNGMVIVGWNNPFPDLSELVVQRSLDSINGFKSIVSMPDPKAISNGFLDKKVDAVRYYYRVFYVRGDLRFTFSPAQKIIRQDNSLNTGNDGSNGSNRLSVNAASDQSNRTTAAQNRLGETNNSLMTASQRTSRNNVPMGTQTKIESLVNEEIFTPSALIFTNKEGDLIVALPDAIKRKYSLKVYNEGGMLFFIMKQITEAQLLVDRSNFFHSGWFRYELYDGTQLKEQNKFFIPAAIH